MSLLGFDALGRLALGQLPPAMPGVNEDSWHQPFNTDVVRQRPPYAAARQQFASYVEAAPFAGVFTPAISQWAPPLSTPAIRRKPMHTGAQQFASFVEFKFAETVSADRWFVPFSEPVRFRRRLDAANHWASVGIEFPLTTSIVSVSVLFTGAASLTGVPTSNYKMILTETKRRLIYAAEISPWTVSNRNS